MIESGIYAITQIDSGHSYIGSSTAISRRFREHRQLLRKGKHHSQALQRAWDKYGEDKFEFCPIVECSRSLFIHIEQFWLDCAGYYNTAKFASHSRLGIKHTEETKRRISEICKSKPLTQEQRAKLSASMKGVKQGPRSQQHRERIRAAKLGTTASPETRAKLSAAMTGRYISPEHRKRISDGLKAMFKAKAASQ